MIDYFNGARGTRAEYAFSGSGGQRGKFADGKRPSQNRPGPVVRNYREKCRRPKIAYVAHSSPTDFDLLAPISAARFRF
jgi:hypothetical protein